MEITQKVIDFAKGQLPNALHAGPGVALIATVYSYDVGIGSDQDENAACVGVKFKIAHNDGGRPYWQCATPLDKQESGRVEPYCEKHNIALRVGGVCPKCLANPEPGSFVPYTDTPILNVVELKPATKEPGDNVVQRLEQALELARKGEIANIAIVAVLNDGDVMDCWGNQSNAFAVVGGLESLKFEFMNGVMEYRE